MARTAYREFRLYVTNRKAPAITALLGNPTAAPGVVGTRLLFHHGFQTGNRQSLNEDSIMIAKLYRHIFTAVGLVFHLVLCCVVVAADPCEFKTQCSCSASSVECDMDYSDLVRSLANRNSRPVFVGKDEKRRPLFPDDYDWKEESRVQNVLHQILKHTDHALPALLEHV